MKKKRKRRAAGQGESQPSRPKITLAMITKNEADVLRDCLDSVQGVADEIVIADTGSDDETVDIAKEYGARVAEFPWTDDFSAAATMH